MSNAKTELLERKRKRTVEEQEATMELADEHTFNEGEFITFMQKENKFPPNEALSMEFAERLRDEGSAQTVPGVEPLW